MPRRPGFLSMLFALAAGALSSPAGAEVPGKTTVAISFAEVPADAQLLAQLRRGGFVLYLRHGYTDNSHPDRLPAVDLSDCSTQRPLTDEGRQLARRVGMAIHQARLPIREIRISPMCRVRETAVAAFPGQAVTIDPLLMYTSNLTDPQKAPLIANTRSLLAAPVAPGGNRLLVGHGPNLMDVMGYFPAEGTLVVFRPLGGSGFTYVASVAPARWPALLRPRRPP